MEGLSVDRERRREVQRGNGGSDLSLYSSKVHYSGRTGRRVGRDRNRGGTRVRMTPEVFYRAGGYWGWVSGRVRSPFPEIGS